MSPGGGALPRLSQGILMAFFFWGGVRILTLLWIGAVRIPSQKIYISTICNVIMMSEWRKNCCYQSPLYGQTYPYHNPVGSIGSTPGLFNRCITVVRLFWGFRNPMNLCQKHLKGPCNKDFNFRIPIKILLNQLKSSVGKVLSILSNLLFCLLDLLSISLFV